MSQELGIPCCQKYWTQKDHEVFANYEREHTRYVSKWSSSEWKWEVKRRKISQELGIPLQQEDWTTDDWERFSQQEHYVVDWGSSRSAKAEVKRRRLDEELGLPFDQEKWNAEDKRKFAEYELEQYRYVDGWSSWTGKCEAQRRQAGEELGIPHNNDDWTTEDKSKYFASGKKDICCWPLPPTPSAIERGGIPGLDLEKEPVNVPKEEAEEQQTKDDINNAANDRDNGETKPRLEAEFEPALEYTPAYKSQSAPESQAPKVDPQLQEPQQAIPGDTDSSRENESNDSNSETPTAPENKPLISAPPPQAPPPDIHHGISPYQAFALLLVALVL